ncbi:MAG: hypothetical protein K2N85_11305 [Lachnospiraceae bacterium]|nr:hypothetical protein [Lachnospiraceae bacterium]
MKAKNTLAKSNLAKNIETADREKAALDAACKKILANKSILARILKTCVEEYENCSLKDIEEKYIEGIPTVAREAVHQDETAAGDSVKGDRNEDSSMTEGTVTYDIKFNVINPLRILRPKTKDSALMMINIEGQTKFYPGYPLIMRGIYYGSRMISSQYGTVFRDSHYEKLEKVYTIWICTNPPKYRKNSINLYSYSEKQLLGKVVEKKKNYDLITVVMICLGDEDDENCKGVIKLLSVLLSKNKSVDEKKKILEEEFGIAMTKTIEREADEMFDYGDYVEEMGRREGRQEGETMLATLLEMLFADGRTEDVKIAVRDKEERNKLYKEYGLVPSVI